MPASRLLGPLLLLAVVATVAGCARRPADVSAPPARGLEVSAGERFTIALESPASAGQRWYLDPPAPDPRVVRVVSSQYRPPAQPLAVAAGEEVWTFEAVSPGSTTLVFSYRRPWAEHGTPPVRRERFTIRVRSRP